VVTALARLFGDPDADPIALDHAMLGQFGAAWLGWEPESVALVLEEEIGRIVPAPNVAKLLACKTLHLVDTFWTRWEVFAWLVQAAGGGAPDFALLQVPTALQCLLSVDAAGEIRADVPWSDEVKAFVACVYRHDSIAAPVAPLDFVAIDTSPWPVDMAEVRARLARRPAAPPGGHTPEDEQVRRVLLLERALSAARARRERQIRALDHA
jgi:hypothetical protein